MIKHKQEITNYNTKIKLLKPWEIIMIIINKKIKITQIDIMLQIIKL
jgi:hypothetical protein